MELGTILEGSDWKLAKKLRREDPEQFYTLVRMHLSFVLDLTTEDCECPVEKDKLRQLLKWGLAAFMKKTRTVVKNGSEGQPLTKQGITQVYQLVEFLSKDDNVVQEGIFRRSGKLTRQQELKSLLNQGIPLRLENGQFSVHDCASVFKSFLANLPEPLLTEAYYPAYCQIAELCVSEKSSDGRLLRALQLLLLLLPEENWLLLKDVIMMLHLTASYEGQNKMTAENLATLFTPHLLCPRKLSPEALHTNAQMLSHVVTFMIRSGLDLFQVPPTLATDIYAYWERKKLSSQAEGCESSAANTVFTFVDRERTAQENTTNPTEAALAQLYAYIQSLPESNKKRRLVKQFNKENGHGTPRHTSSRTCSFGDSIKKRIFNKSSKSSKPLIENNLIKSGRSSSEELLDETMMTPRSRKPVVALSGSNICHLANMTWGVKDSSWPSSEQKNDILKPQISFDEDSLTSPFRDYLLSRSILTTSPVDLSFSSRTGDFDPSSFSDDLLPSPLNESLLQCMDGNCVGSSSDSDSISSRKRDASALNDEFLSKRERSSTTSGHSTESSKEAVFETSL
ncbi:rho GTPase activating protein at 54D isoform X2 [Lycorma delicatula]|uniref:rho GTPase activating protein at 54D isoform X2 n=1 Tax=Lycorma delicatula TaxID=130591 RepID=UPI003F515D45